MRILILIFAFTCVANAMSTTPYTPTGPVDIAGLPEKTAVVNPVGGFNSLTARNQITRERSPGATGNSVVTNAMAQMFPMLGLGGSGTSGASGGSLGGLGGIGSLFGGGHAEMDPMSQMFSSMFGLGGSGAGGSSNVGGLGSLFGGGGTSLQSMALMGTGTDQLLSLAGMDCMMNSGVSSTAMDPACMMLMMQQMGTGL